MRGPLAALVRLYFDIAIWRRGPQHVPAVGILLPITLLAYFFLTALLTAFLPLPMPRLSRLEAACVDVVFMAVWYWGLLALYGKRERYAQTASAIFGYQTLLAPLLGLSDWLIQHAAADSIWQMPAYLLALAAQLWTIIAMAHILRASLERSLWVGMGLAFLQVLAEEATLALFFGPGK
jgi:hypothetical protein